MDLFGSNFLKVSLKLLAFYLKNKKNNNKNKRSCLTKVSKAFSLVRLEWLELLITIQSLKNQTFKEPTFEKFVELFGW